MNDKIKKCLDKAVVILAIAVSLYFFGFTFLFGVSLAFIIYLSAHKALKRIQSSSIIVLAPFVLISAKTVVLTRYEYKPVISFFNELFIKYHIDYCLTKDIVDTILVSILLFAIASFVVREQSSLEKVSPGGNPEFKEKPFIDRLEAFCESYSQRIDSVNRQQNWNNALYVPIETEVELTKGHRIKRYDDLIKCLKKNKKKSPAFIRYIIKKIGKSRICKVRIINKIIRMLESGVSENVVYLVLGDPGSGKSVSLRKLCSELLKETHITGKVPVYISLQTWSPESGVWSEGNLPTKMDFINYIKAELYKEGDYFTNGFLDDYLMPMLEDGRFYFVFDSFDEMPCFMGGDNNGVLIKRISEIIHEFLTGPNQCGGIIASRLYNRPSDYLEQTYTLRLQKFNNDRIRKMIKRYLTTDADNTVMRLFKDRGDLVELCRNPFYLSLLIDYLKKNANEFPNNQFLLFKDFIERRLSDSKSRIISEKFTLEEIYEAAIDISVIMQNDVSSGLDLPIDKLFIGSNRYDKERWEKCISVLKYAKICRTGGNSQTISFVHRRFQEFFFVEAIIKGDITITDKEFQGILDNTGIRDALVLYCQISEEKRIQSIIDYCCSCIADNECNIGGVLNDGSVKLVNAVYFLIEAFSNRKDALKENIRTVSELRKHLKKETHYIVQMAIVNSISLLSIDEIQKTLIDVFSLNNRWLNTLLFSKCQLIKKLDRRIENEFIVFLENSGIGNLIRNFRNDDFSLSLTSCFSYIRRVHLFLPGVFVAKAILYVWSIMHMLIPVKYYGKIIATFVKTYSPPLYKQQISRADYAQSIAIYQSEIAKSFVKQPSSVIRTILSCGGNVISIFALFLLFAELVMVISVFQKEAGPIFRKIMGRSIKDIVKGYISLIFFIGVGKRKAESEKSKKPGNRTNALISWLISSYEIFLLVLSIRYYTHYSPIDSLFYLFVFLQVYLTVYYTTRFIHEVIMPLITNKDIQEVLLYYIKVFPILFCLTLFVTVVNTVCIVSILILLIYGIPTFICHIFGIRYSVMNGIALMLLILICVLITLIIVHVILGGRDCLRLFAYAKRKERIDRKELIQIISEFYYSFAKRRYVQGLISKGVLLYGEWPKDYSLKIKDDVTIRSLAEWDCKEMGVDNTYIEVI